jgi:hypothetical protein
MHAARPPRAAARLSAFLPTFPQALRPFSIWLSIWIGVFGGLFGGLCASTAAAQLPSAKELSGLQTQIEQRLARLGIAREGKNGLRVGSIQASREDGKIVLRAPLHGSAKGSATWNLPAGLRLEEPRVELVVIEATNSEKREFEGALLGTLVLGRSLRLPSESRLSKDPAKFSLSARSERPLSLTSLATALGGEKARKVFAPLPARLRDAKLQSARLRVYPRIKRVALQAGSSLGKVDLVAEPDKGLFVCIAPDPSFRFAQLDPALRILDSLDLDLAKMGFTISSFDGDLGEALAHVGRGLRGRIRSGLNLSSTVDLDKLGLARLLKAQRADIAGVIPYPHPQGLELSARLPTELPIGKAGKFREIDLVLRPAPKQMKVGLRGRMQLRVDGQLLDLVGELAVEAATQTLKGSVRPRSTGQGLLERTLRAARRRGIQTGAFARHDLWHRHPAADARHAGRTAAGRRRGSSRRQRCIRRQSARSEQLLDRDGPEEALLRPHHRARRGSAAPPHSAQQAGQIARRAQSR